MELSGEVKISATPVRVWQALNDAVVLQACIPGCEQVEDVSPGLRHVRVMVKMGPVRARFNGKVSLSDVVEAQSCLLSFEGSGGAAGMATGKSHVTLSSEGASTRLHYTVHASVGGKLGQIGGRMIDASARQLADQFFTALRSQLEPAVEEAALKAGASVTQTSALGPEEPALPGNGVEVATAAVGGVNPMGSPASPAPRAHDGAPRPLPPPTRLPDVPAGHAGLSPEASRLLWFAMGVASTAFGVWLGAHLF